MPPTILTQRSTGRAYRHAGELGRYLDEFPDYRTQGATSEDLREHLLDLYRDLTSGELPNVRRHAQLELA